MCSSSASRELNKSCTVIGYKSKQYGQPWSLRIICCVVDKNCALYTMYYVHQACLAKMAGCEHWSLLNAILIMTHTCYHFQKTWQKEWTWPIFSHVELMLTSQELPCASVKTSLHANPFIWKCVPPTGSFSMKCFVQRQRNSHKVTWKWPAQCTELTDRLMAKYCYQTRKPCLLFMLLLPLKTTVQGIHFLRSIEISHPSVAHLPSVLVEYCYRCWQGNFPHLTDQSIYAVIPGTSLYPLFHWRHQWYWVDEKHNIQSHVNSLISTFAPPPPLFFFPAVYMYMTCITLPIPRTSYMQI